MPTDCIPRFAHPLPVVPDAAPCTECQKEIARLREEIADRADSEARLLRDVEQLTAEVSALVEGLRRVEESPIPTLTARAALRDYEARR